MKNDFFDQYHDNYENSEGTSRQERAYDAPFRPEDPQPAYRQNTGYAPHHVRSTAWTTSYNRNSAPSAHEPKEKKKKSGMSAGAVAAVLSVCILLSGVAGFGGSYLFSQLNPSSSDTASEQPVVNKVTNDNSIAKTSADQTNKETSEIVSEVADSVVEITTEVVQTDSFYGQYVAEGAGSGVIISDEGFILTNNHVIDGASTINVTLRSGDNYEAKLVGTDADLDIALLKIEASGLTTATVGDSSAVIVGDKSVIIGNPLGTLGGSVTEGIVSAVDRAIEIDGKTMHLMQTDAAVNPGNSGGGMFNGQGELVGIVVAKSSDSSSGSTIDNIGFVIPINNALDILGDLQQYGYVRGKASTGMSFTENSGQMYAQYFGNTAAAGVYVASVKADSNAAKAGFSVGDRVVSVDGTAVNSFTDLKTIISEHSVGDTVKFEIERSGRTGTIDLTLEEYSPES